jgi:hypothetical protein
VGEVEVGELWEKDADGLEGVEGIVGKVEVLEGF